MERISHLDRSALRPFFETFMQELHRGSVLIGCTEELDQLDPLIFNYFQHRIFCPLPTEAQRASLIHRFIAKHNVQAALSYEDVNTLASKMHCFSGVDIEQLIKSAIKAGHALRLKDFAHLLTHQTPTTQGVGYQKYLAQSAQMNDLQLQLQLQGDEDDGVLAQHHQKQPSPVRTQQSAPSQAAPKPLTLEQALEKVACPLLHTALTKLPLIYPWDAADSVKLLLPYVVMAPKLQNLQFLCQKTLARCKDTDIAYLLKLSDGIPDLTLLRETLLERVSFESSDLGIDRKKDLEAIHLLRLCGSNPGERWQNYYGPSKLSTNRLEQEEEKGKDKKAKEKEISDESGTFSGRDVTFEMACREYELALQNEWTRIIQILEKHLVRCDLVEEMWVGAVYFKLELMQQKCMAEIRKKVPIILQRIEGQFPPVLVDLLADEVQLQMQMAQETNTSGASSGSLTENDIAWDEISRAYGEDDEELSDQEGDSVISDAKSLDEELSVGDIRV